MSNGKLLLVLIKTLSVNAQSKLRGQDILNLSLCSSSLLWGSEIREFWIVTIFCFKNFKNSGIKVLLLIFLGCRKSVFSQKSEQLQQQGTGSSHIWPPSELSPVCGESQSISAGAADASQAGSLELCNINAIEGLWEQGSVKCVTFRWRGRQSPCDVHFLALPLQPGHNCCPQTRGEKTLLD